MEGGVVAHAADLVRFDPGATPALVLPPWPGLDRAARRAEAAGARVLRLAPAPRPGGVRDWLAQRPVELLHVHYANAGDATPAVEAALAAGIRVVSTDHACARAGEETAWEARRRVVPFQAALLADSAAIARGLEQHLGYAVQVIPHGIDGQRFLDSPDRLDARRALRLPTDVPVVVSAGALFSSKGMHHLVHAVSELHPPPLLVIAGEGPERPRLVANARALGVDLRLLGWMEDVRPVFAAADVFALASESEGLPSVVLQAMAAGRPVVAFDVGGVGEALGPHGLLIPPGDEHALGAAIQRVLAGELAGQLEAARARVDSQFEVRQLAGRVAALHASL